MNYSWKIYIALGFVFLFSLLFSIFIPVTQILHDISTIPAIMALIGAVYQIFRDQAAFEKQLLLQQKQNQFTLGAASHMANVAFDKHVEFCEEYISEMHKTVSTLFTEGPTELALNHAANLYKIQQKYAAWLTPSISESIDPFEQALRTIGANAHFVRFTIGTGDEGRPEAIREMYDTFKDVLNMKKDESKPLNKEIATTAIINKLRAVLGIEKLTMLRQSLIEKSTSTLERIG